MKVIPKMEEVEFLSEWSLNPVNPGETKIEFARYDYQPKFEVDECMIREAHDLEIDNSTIEYCTSCEDFGVKIEKVNNLSCVACGLDFFLVCPTCFQCGFC